MNKSYLVTLEEFETDVLWPAETHGDVPIPKPSRKALDAMTKVVRNLFLTEGGKRRRGVSEDTIAQAIVDNIIMKEQVFPGNLGAALSQNNYHRTDSTKSKVDAALYPLREVPTDGCPNWTHLRLFIEFKKGGVSNDPFDDKSANPESWARSRAGVRGQLLAYASKTFEYQHRTALYSLLINGDEFRAMHWDRSGLIVTEATNYLDDPASLLRFLWAFAKLSDEQQGIDPTATLLSENSGEYELMDALAEEDPELDMPFQEHADITKFFAEAPGAGPGAGPDAAPPTVGPAAGTRLKEKQRAVLAPANPPQPKQPVFKYVREGFKNSLVAGWPRYKLLVGADKREFLVAKPIFSVTSMFGRGTRGYIALDVRDRRFVFLKDSWRPFYEGVEPEGNYLKAMAAKPDVKLVVPTVVEHGDVLQQTTFVAEYTTTQSAHSAGAAPSTPVPSDAPAHGKKRPRQEEEEEAHESTEIEECEESRLFIHYRIAVEEVCLKMGEHGFSSGKQLVRLILDCIYTHRDAYEHFGLLHRDISSGNILIVPQVQTGRRTGKRRVLWKGLLTDWELAKYVPKDNSPQRARQPERTGTWQFMSVAYVRHPERPVVVADELESFFHVLLHHAIRYLRHSFQGVVTSFIISYFDTFQNKKDNANVRACNALKQAAVTRGEIQLDEEDLVFWMNKDGDNPSHPLNALLKGWLVLFQARYLILRKEDGKLARTEAPPKQQNVTDITLSRAQEDDEDDDFLDDAQLRTKASLAASAAASAAAAAAVVAKAAALEAEANSAETKATAAQLETHSATISIFETHLHGPDFKWPTDDVVGDQLDPKLYNPRKHIVALSSIATSNLTSGKASVAASSKRAKLDTGVVTSSGSASTTRNVAPATRAKKPTKPTRSTKPMTSRRTHARLLGI